MTRSAWTRRHQQAAEPVGATVEQTASATSVA
jgi:hypothetical protein